MAQLLIPDDLERFIVAHVPTIVHLEALLLLREQSTPCAIETLSSLLFIQPARAARTMADLVAGGLVARVEPTAYQYSPSPELRVEVDRLAETYRTALIQVTRFIHARQDAAALHRFADAFRFRKE